MSNVKMTMLDELLLQMANENWEQFVSLVGANAINQAKICLLRKNGNSYGEIANRINKTKRAARWGCGKCENKE